MVKVIRKAVAVVSAAALAMALVPAVAFANDTGAETNQTTYEDEWNAIGSSYRKVDLAAEGKLGLPTGVSAARPDAGDGVVLSGTVSALKADRVSVSGSFVFEEDKPVGRISIGGLAELGTVATVGVYLDDASNPVAELTLDSQPEKGVWNVVAERTQNVYGTIPAGNHTVSLGIDVAGKAGGKRASVLVRSIEFVQCSLPTVYFEPDESTVDGEKYGTLEEMNGSPDHSMWCRGAMNIQVPAGYVNEYGGQPQTSYEGLDVDIRGRGNSTWELDSKKKPYRLKLEKKKDLFGMGENKHWALIANAFDGTLMRNRMTYWLGAQIGLEYTPKCVPVDVVFDGPTMEATCCASWCERVKTASTCQTPPKTTLLPVGISLP